MARSILLDHLHPGPGDAIAARQAEEVDVAVGARGGRADEVGQVVVLDDSEAALGIADGPAIDQERLLGPEQRRDRLEGPVALVERHLLAVGARDDRDVPVGRERHPRVHLHFTPTHASWLNQIDCWFSILAMAALKGASFTSPAQLRQAIDGFIEVYNETAEPFEWTKAEVHPVSPKRYIANLRR
jgi:hypothetical protein